MVLPETEVSCFFSKFLLVHLMSVAKSWWKWGVKMEKLEKQETEVDFSPEVTFFLKFFLVHLMSVAKSWWNWGPKMAKMLKKGNGSGFFHRKWQKKPISVSGFQKMTNFLGISTGSSSSFFKIFKASRALWQKVGENGVWKWQNC